MFAYKTNMLTAGYDVESVLRALALFAAGHVAEQIRHALGRADWLRPCSTSWPI